MSLSQSMLTIQVSDHNLDSQLCLPIRKEKYTSQVSMRTLVLVMFMFLFLDMATSFPCFKSVYYESIPGGMDSFPECCPNQVFQSRRLDTRSYTAITLWVPWEAAISASWWQQNLWLFLFCLKLFGGNGSYSIPSKNIELGSERCRF